MMSCILADDNHDLLQNMNPPAFMMTIGTTRSKKPYITQLVTSDSKSCKNWLKSRKIQHARYSCSAPVLILGTCATRITLKSFLALF